jgi:hypothetical protein
MTGAAFWPWWLAAASLAVVTVGCCVVARRPLGVSGILARFVNLRDELDVERQRRAAEHVDPAALEAAMLAATAEAFGPAAPVDAVFPGPAFASPRDPGMIVLRAPGSAPCADPLACAVPAEELPAADPRRGCERCASPAARPTLGAHAVFLCAMVLGGLAAQAARGGWSARLDMGPTFHALFGTGAGAWLALGAGGLLVGAGTTLSGGCSTGHGLSGCSRLQPAGVAATASFVAAAVAVSLVLERSLS